MPAAEFLLWLAERGIDTHHSSAEYDTDSTYTDALTVAQKRAGRFRHIVKISEPSWDDIAFSPDRFIQLVDQERRRLDCDKIAVVQWLVRTKDPADDHFRREIIKRDRNVMIETFAQLRESNALEAVVGFPYTQGVAAELTDTSLGPSIVDGLAVYLNTGETEYLPLIRAVPTVAIRPFNGGKIAVADRAESLGFVLAHSTVASAVVSLSSRRHATEILRWSSHC